MNKKCAECMKRIRTPAVERGFMCFAMVALIAMHNINCRERFVSDKVLRKMMKLWEKECERIIREEGKNDLENIADIVVAKNDEVRKMYRMDEEEE